MTLYLLSGRTLTGRLTNIWAYDLGLEVNGRACHVLKHSVEYAVMSSPPDPVPCEHVPREQLELPFGVGELNAHDEPQNYLHRADDPISRRQIVERGYVPHLYGFQGRSNGNGLRVLGYKRPHNADDLFWDGESVVDKEGKGVRLAGTLLWQMRKMVFAGEFGATIQGAKIDIPQWHAVGRIIRGADDITLPGRTTVSHKSAPLPLATPASPVKPVSSAAGEVPFKRQCVAGITRSTYGGHSRFHSRHRSQGSPYIGKTIVLLSAHSARLAIAHKW